MLLNNSFETKDHISKSKESKPRLLHLLAPLAFLSLTIHCNPQPTISLPSQECSLDRLPILVQPVRDVENNNELVSSYCAAYAREDGVTMELSFVFADEDKPGSVIDSLYDTYRLLRYRRKQDVETVQMHFDKMDNLLDLEFDTTYSGSQKFYESEGKHFTSRIQASRFESIDGRIVLYVNTWNHMFSETDNNPELRKDVRTDYPVFSASRDELDASYHLW